MAQSESADAIDYRDGVCSSPNCVRDEPGDLVTFKLAGTIQPVHREFCHHHDPRQDPRTGMLWEVLEDGS